MPGFDGTGPRGQGPRTGGGFGNCPPSAEPYFYGQPSVYGVGRGGRPRGGGRGFAHGGGRGRQWGYGRASGVAPQVYPVPQPQMTSEQELEWLKEQSHMMQDQLSQISARISELTADQEKT